jgi:hypothetical protein
MERNTIAIIAGLALVLIVGLVVFNRGDDSVAQEANATTTNSTAINDESDLTGTGGPEEGVSGFENFQNFDDDGNPIEDKG